MVKIILWALIIFSVIYGLYCIIKRKPLGCISFIFAVLVFFYQETIEKEPIAEKEVMTEIEQEQEDMVEANASKKTDKKETNETKPKVVLVKEEKNVDLDTSNTVKEESEKEFIEIAEKERNNSIEQANNIEVNNKYKGKMSDTNDTDYYKFTIKQAGKINITFEHEKIDSSYIYWELDLLDSMQNESIIEMDSVGGNTKEESNNARISPGEYYLRIEPYNHSDIEYQFTINFLDETEFCEVESNNTIETANEIEIGYPYTANLQTSRDIDYFKFSIPNKGKINFSFEHEKIDSSYTYWRIKVLDGMNDDIVITVDSKGGDSTLQSDSARVPAGEYYIKVEASSYLNTDYRLCLKYESETEQYESEKNDSFAEAYAITLGGTYAGNSQSSNDTDYYYIDILESSSITVSFSHDLIDSTWTYWNVYFIPENGNQQLMHIPIKGNNMSDSALIENVTPGRYYVKVVPSSYHNMDYAICIY